MILVNKDNTETFIALLKFCIERMDCHSLYRSDSASAGCEFIPRWG